MIGKTISHYKILKKLGEGGMGEVFLADDTKLKRYVVLKFLSPHLTADKEATERFEREAQAAAALNHPNIITIHEIGEFEGRLFIAMEYAEGESLRERLNTPLHPPSRGDIGGCSPLQIDNVIDYATQICEGLRAAHQTGIIHRDIKPENILVDKSGRVKILDFGLARMKGVTKLTKEASTLGTLKYMSPEQYQNKGVDHRTDIWSFGVVLFEMLTAQVPFRGEYEAAVMYSVVNEEPVSVSSIREDVPQNLEQIVGKALEKDPAMRYQSMQEVLEELKKPISSVTAKEKKQKSIVVLPFDDMSPNKDNEYFSDGLTEEIITDLSQIHTLRVISRNSAMMLKGTRKATKTIGRELNVQYVLEGSVRKAGNNLRITAQLIDAANDAHLWANKYSGTLDDVFDIQEKVSRAIVDALQLELTSKESSKMAEHSFQNIQAFECFLKARYEIWRFTGDGLARALHHLQNGLSLIGDHELLLAAKGMVYWQYINAGINPDKKYFQEIHDIIKKVFDLNSEFAHGYFLRGVYNYLHQNFKEAVNDLKSAIHLDPNNPDTLIELSRIYISAGKTDAARPLVKRLLEIDPLTPLNQCFPGYIDFSEGKFNRIVEPHYRMYQLDPKNPLGRWFYTWSLFWNQRFGEAYEIIDILINETPESLFTKFGLFWKYAFQGKRKDALKVMTEDILDRARGVEVFARMVFHGYAILDEKEKTIDWIEHAVNHGFVNYPFLDEYDYLIENIRGEERFKKLMKRVKKEWENFEV
jgi:serine/threonine protein kinase